MLIREYDKIKLKSGELAYIVEILEQGKAYIADINRKGETETCFIKQNEIEKTLS